MGAVTLCDRGMMDDKLICTDNPVSAVQREGVLRSFRLYARCKGLLNLWRGRPGCNGCEGWYEADLALSLSRVHAKRTGPAQTSSSERRSNGQWWRGEVVPQRFDVSEEAAADSSSGLPIAVVLASAIIAETASRYQRGNDTL